MVERRERASEREREREGVRWRARDRERCEDGGRRAIYADTMKLLSILINKSLDYVYVFVCPG